MKLSLAGPSYTARSVAAAAQQTMNLYPEAVEAQNEQRMALYGRPGLKLFTTMSPAKIRAMWSGGGRLFIVHGGKVTEVSETAVQTVRPGTVAQGPGFWSFPGEDWPFPDPAQVFSNGHQLLVISGGLVYWDNGDATGVQPAKFTVEGTGNTVAASQVLTRVTGPAFGTGPSTWTGSAIEVDGIIYSVSGVIDANNLIVTGVPALTDRTNIVWRAPQGAQITGITGGFLDGYFIVSRPPAPGTVPDLGRNFNWSAVNDAAWWNEGVDFGVKEGASDYIHSILCDHEELWIFGTETTEVWSNVGGDFTFQRNPGAFIHEGSSAVYAPCSVGLSICGLAGGANGQTIAFRVQGLQPQRISTHAQEQEWNQTGFRVNDATSYGYSEGGHVFWVLNFWDAQRTWVYDLTTGLWHERALWDTTLGVFKRQKAWFHAFLPEWGTMGKHIVGDPTDGKLYEMSTNFTDDDGATILYRRAFPHLINENQWAYIHRLEILAEMGALAGGDTVPQMVLDGSRDYGHTFINPRSVTMGSSGQYTRRAVWRRLGKARDYVPRVTIEAKVKIALIDAYLEATPGFA